jgi:amino acid transporter
MSGFLGITPKIVSPPSGSPHTSNPCDQRLVHCANNATTLPNPCEFPLTDYVIFVNWIFFGLVILSIFFIRRRQPRVEGIYRAWGYPVVPLLFLVTTSWLLISTLITSPTRSLISLVLVALGLPVYYLQSRATSREIQPEAGATQSRNRLR